MGVYKYGPKTSEKKGKPKAIPSSKPVAPKVHAEVMAERDVFKGQIDKLTTFLAENYSKDIKDDETAVALALRLLEKKATKKPAVNEG